MQAEIIAVGTELLLGQIANTNAQYISEKLAQLGIDVYYHSVVGDNRARLEAVVEAAKKRANLIIFTGGLGPTKDDLTKETIADCIGKTLVTDAQAMKRIEDYFIQRGIPMTENNRKQAVVIESSKVFPNDFGMAPGMAVFSEGIQYILLPGPPRELKPMFEKYVVPHLMSLVSDSRIVHSKVLRFFGIGESALEERLVDLIDSQSNPTIAPLAKESEVTLRLTAKARNVDEANQMIQDLESIIEKRVGKYIYGYDQDSLPGVAVKELQDLGLKLAVAESCTGGLISHMITGIPGCSSVYAGGVVSYATEIKRSLLGVSQQLLDQHGAVSPETAIAMANQVRSLLKTDCGLSVTGVAGPDAQEGKPVGLVYIGISAPHEEQVHEVKLSGMREMIQMRAAKYGLYYLLRSLKKFKGMNE